MASRLYTEVSDVSKMSFFLHGFKYSVSVDPVLFNCF